MTEQEKLVFNEQAKLRATFLNNCGVASIATGAFTFLWTIMNNPGHAAVLSLVTMLGALLIGAMFHRAGTKMLKELVSEKI